MDFKNLDPKKLTVVLNGIGVIIMFLWGTFGNAWDKSWIAVAVSGVLSGIIWTLGGGEKK